MPVYVEQAPWALVVLVVCLGALVLAAAFGIVAVARLTTCSANEAANALATVLTAFRGRVRTRDEREIEGVGARAQSTQKPRG